MRKRSEAITPPDVLATLLAAASERAVLIGGQALGFWITHHHLALPAGIVAISNDADFLARSASDRGLVTTFAHVLHGKACFPPERSLTALVGQAVRELPNDEDLNVDVLFSVFGLDANAVWRRARTMGDGELTFQVMHPLDVLHSRLANLYKLREKQNDKGILQLRSRP